MNDINKMMVGMDAVAMEEFLFGTHEARMRRNKIELVKRLNKFLITFPTQQKAADYLGTTQPRISNLVNLEVDKFSLELILEYLDKFNIYFEIKNIDNTLFISVE